MAPQKKTEVTAAGFNPEGLAQAQAPVEGKKLTGPRTADLDTSPRAAKDIDENPTPEYILTLSPYFDYAKHISCGFYSYLVPFLAAHYMWTNSVWLTGKDVLMIFLYGYAKIILTFGIYHRYFAHFSYSTSRAFACVLNVLAATGAQRGPIWWGSKHVRHHKFCENEGDPHSPLHEGFWYAWIGWVFYTKETNTDWEFVHAHLKTPEMFFVDGIISLFVPWVEVYLYYKYFGLHTMLLFYMATVATIFITLGFNVFLHHDESIPKTEQDNGRYICRAHDKTPDLIKYSLDLIGEMNHYDHHRYPRKALHPSSLIDVPYWFFIWPCEKLGLVWDVNYGGVGKVVKQPTHYYHKSAAATAAANATAAIDEKIKAQ